MNTAGRCKVFEHLQVLLMFNMSLVTYNTYYTYTLLYLLLLPSYLTNSAFVPVCCVLSGCLYHLRCIEAILKWTD